MFIVFVFLFLTYFTSNDNRTIISISTHVCCKGHYFILFRASLIAQLVENPPVMQETPVRFLGQEDPLEKGWATHSSILASRIPWTIRFMGSQRVGPDLGHD